MRYLVSYDLAGPDKDYQPLWDALAGLGARRILKSQWILRAQDMSAERLFDRLVPFVIARGGRLLVTEYDGTDCVGGDLLFNPDDI